MVQCESCEVWLHAICFGLREEKSIPENFFCEKCHPREFKCICNQVRIKKKRKKKKSKLVFFFRILQMEK